MTEKVCTQGHAYNGEKCVRCGGVEAAQEPLETEEVVEVGTEAEAAPEQEAEVADAEGQAQADADAQGAAEAEAAAAEAEAEAEEDVEDLE